MGNYENGTLGSELEFDKYGGLFGKDPEINSQEIDRLEHHIISGHCFLEEEPSPGEVLRLMGYYDENDKRSCIQQKKR